MTAQDDLLEQLADACKKDDQDMDLAGTALLLAGLDHPDIPLEVYRRHLAGLAADVAALSHRGSSLEGRAWAIARVLFERHGFEGDRSSYDDMDNANLMRVIDRKKGIPVSLGILYIHIARSIGWTIEGLNFPTHFLLRLDGHGDHAIVDPFESGIALDAPALCDLAKQVMGPNVEMDRDWFDPLGNRGILLRLQNNIRTRSIQSGELERAAEITRRMILVAPGSITLQRDLGMVEAHRGNVGAAIAAFYCFLEHDPQGPERSEAKQMLNKLKRVLN